MYKITVIALTAIVLATATAATAESLWKPDSSESQFCDKRAAKVGDIVTIVIVESATSTSSASTDTKKATSLQAGPGIGPILSKIPALGYSDNDSVQHRDRPPAPRLSMPR